MIDLTASANLRPRSSAPAQWRMLAELPRTALTCAKLPFQTATLAAAPRGQNDPVLVLPGFAASDSSTAMLRSYLRWLGHDVYRWDLGRNLGAKTVGLHNEVLVEKLEAIHAARGRKVAVVGWSMGGIMARLIARARPHMSASLFCLARPSLAILTPIARGGFMKN